MITLKFLQPKGCVPAGYIGSYPEDEANSLIAKGVAELYTEKKSAKKAPASEGEV